MSHIGYRRNDFLHIFLYYRIMIQRHKMLSKRCLKIPFAIACCALIFPSRSFHSFSYYLLAFFPFHSHGLYFFLLSSPLCLRNRFIETLLCDFKFLWLPQSSNPIYSFFDHPAWPSFFLSLLILVSYYDAESIFSRIHHISSLLLPQRAASSFIS